RGGHPAAVVVAVAPGTPAGAVPEVGAPEQEVVDIPLDGTPAPARGAYGTAAAAPAPGAL
ncbi:MFS transporter, partial [Streptomyces sp. SID14436]|nr:MFS transporter [Streptomyces sp. SID14436]